MTDIGIDAGAIRDTVVTIIVVAGAIWLGVMLLFALVVRRAAR